MKVAVSLLFLATAAGAAYRQPSPAQRALGAMLAHAESASMYRARVDWRATKAEVMRLAGTAHSVRELSPALRHLLVTLGDEHARVIHGGRPIAWYNAPPAAHLAGFDTDLYNKIQYATAFPFKATLLSGRIGYVRIVGLPMGDNAAMAKQIEDAVCAVHRQGATRWIVDLRYNGGGNLNPMAEGIAGLIGDGAIGGWNGATTAENGEWTISRGDFVNHGYSIRLPNACRIPADRKVAVLTSMYTASSGEALAVMFRGRAGTRIFGSKTLGMITVTDWTSISDSTAITISVGHYRDRTGRVYDRFVEPDEELPFVPTDSLQADPAVRRASAWLVR